VSWLVRLYPPAWRKRYGRELEVLVEGMPGRFGLALDLVVGAAIAYRDAMRANRLSSAAGAYLDGLVVAVLLQAILFISLVLAGQGSTTGMDFGLGPFSLVTVRAAPWFRGELRSLTDQVLIQTVARPVATELLLLGALIAALGLVLAVPRMLRTLK